MESGDLNKKTESGFIQKVVDTAKRVITQPVDFFRSMPKEGGFQEPLLFAIAMGVAGGVVSLILGIFGLGMYPGFVASLVAIVIMPIMVIIGVFIGTAVLFGIWKLMGSQQNFETAFRCVAYMSAIIPIVILLNIVPYLGSLLGVAWQLYLVVTASVEVHAIESRKAWIVFGIIAVILALWNISAERSVARMEKSLEQLGTSMEDLSSKSPEEIGEALGKFMKGVQKGAEQQP